MGYECLFCCHNRDESFSINFSLKNLISVDLVCIILLYTSHFNIFSHTSSVLRLSSQLNIS